MKVFLFACLYQNETKYGVNLIFAKSLNEALEQFKKDRPNLSKYELLEVTNELEKNGFTYKGNN